MLSSHTKIRIHTPTLFIYNVICLVIALLHNVHIFCTILQIGEPLTLPCKVIICLICLQEL